MHSHTQPPEFLHARVQSVLHAVLKLNGKLTHAADCVILCLHISTRFTQLLQFLVYLLSLCRSNYTFVTAHNCGSLY